MRRPIGLAFGVTGLVLLSASAHAACPAGAISLPVGSNIGQRAQAAPEGAVFCIRTGIHRLQQVRPRDRQKFYGEAGAIMNGAQRITRFEREGVYWVATGQTQRGIRHATQECLPERPRCSYPEAFFINNVPLLSVASKAAVEPGSFFFDYARDRIYFLDNPTGKIVEASVRPYAFASAARDVLIKGLTVEKYSTPIQAGAIGSNIAPKDWIIRRNEVRLNHAVGIVVGSGSRIQNNFAHHNGEMGVGCGGDNILIEDNEMAHNGFFAGLDPLWEGGGGKCAETDHLIVRGNYSHHNNSFGFWTDIDSINTLYEDNRIEYNANGGISHEISYAAIIRRNTFKGNGAAFRVWLWGGAIQIQNSQNVQVYRNTIDTAGAGNGITLIQQNRGTGKYGPYVTVRNNIHHNVITTLDRGASGAIADYDRAGMKAGHNRFEHNVYTVTDPRDDHWAWVDGFYDWTTYRRKSGQDASSRLVLGP